MTSNKEVVTFRSIESNRNRIEQLQSHLTEGADKDDDILGRHGEVPRSDVVDAIVFAFFAAGLDHEQAIEYYINLIDSGDVGDEYEYELTSSSR